MHRFMSGFKSGWWMPCSNSQKFLKDVAGIMKVAKIIEANSLKKVKRHY
jgi:hypothetical protein